MENKNTKIGLIVIVLLVITLCLGGFIIYDKVLKENTTKLLNSNNNTKVEENNNKNDKNNNKDIINALGKSLYERTLAMNRDWYYYLYTDIYTYNMKTTLKEKDLDNKTKLTIAYKIAGKDREINYYPNMSECTNEYNYEECYIENIPKNKFEQSYYEVFGTNNIKYEEFSVDDWKMCNLTNNYVSCVDGRMGNDADVYQRIRYKYTELQDKEIIIYVEMIAIDEFNDKDLEEKSFFQKYNDAIKKYKVTFKQNENKDYYWYSSELVK